MKTILALLLALHLMWSLAAAANDEAFTVEVTATAEREVTNDWLIASLSVERSGADSAALAGEVAALMRQALAEGKKHPDLKLATSAYSTQPRYESAGDGRSRQTGWRISQSLTLEGDNIEDATALMGALQAMDLKLVNLGFTISHKQRQHLAAELTAEALEEWKQKARAAIQQLGGRQWQPQALVISDGGSYSPMPRAMRLDTAVMAAAPAVEAGTSRLQVSVSGQARATRAPEASR